jgi:hypothetical protein
MASKKIGDLLKTMQYVDYLSPGQFGELKGELAGLLGVGGPGWEEGEPTAYEDIINMYIDLGYSEQEAEDRAAELKEEGLLDPFFFFGEAAGIGEGAEAPAAAPTITPAEPSAAQSKYDWYDMHQELIMPAERLPRMETMPWDEEPIPVEFDTGLYGGSYP